MSYEEDYNEDENVSDDINMDALTFFIFMQYNFRNRWQNESI